MNNIVGKKKIWFSISGIVMAIGLVFLFMNGLNYGIDFQGGTKITININKDFKKSDVDVIVDKYAKERYSTKKANEDKEIEIIVQEGILNDEQINSLVNEIQEKYSLEKTSLIGTENIGATVGKELKQKAIIGLVLSALGILIYVTIRFEFNFAVAAIIALTHDVILTVLFYSVFGIQVNTPFIAAILTIAGYSINDTIVIFDRIRENQKKNRRQSPEEVANESVVQTLSRSINTTITTLITIVSVYIFVPSIREFSLPLIVGIVTGAYSSIFIASPIWVIMKKRKGKNKKAVTA